jgi:hypothetical protein
MEDVMRTAIVLIRLHNEIVDLAYLEESLLKEKLNIFFQKGYEIKK